MGFINFIAELLKDPRTAIAGWIAAGPVMAYGCVFLIIFIETGVVFFPFLPGDSLLFASGFFAADGGFNIVALLGVAWAAAILGDQCNFMIGHFFGGIPFVQEHFELLIVGIVLVSVIPTVAGLIKAKLGKKQA